MTIQKSIVLSETVYISRASKRQLSVLAALSAAAAGSDIPNIDALADEILSKYLAAIPNIAEREEAVKKALKDIEKQFKAAEQPTPAKT